MQSQKSSTWEKVVYAPFKKIMKFDFFYLVLGVAMGMGIGAYIVTRI